MSDKTAVSTIDAPTPAHSYSQGVRKGNLLQVSGQGPVDPVNGEYLYPGDVRAQTLRTLQNVEAVLTAGGATFDDVVMVRVFLTTRDDFAAMACGRPAVSCRPAPPSSSDCPVKKCWSRSTPWPSCPDPSCPDPSGS